MWVTASTGSTRRVTGWERLVRKADEVGAGACPAGHPTGGGVVDTAVTGPAVGFVWVVVTPGTSAFARWLVARGLGASMSRDGRGGVCLGVPVRPAGAGPDGGRLWSLPAMQAYAEAFVRVLDEAGIVAEVRSVTV